MNRVIYKVLFSVIIIICTALFFKEVSTKSIAIGHIDKVAHFGVFFVLTAILSKALKAPIWFYVCVLGIYGAGVELVQGTLPHRQASFADFIADVAGIIAYLVIYHFWQQRGTKQNT